MVKLEQAPLKDQAYLQSKNEVHLSIRVMAKLVLLGGQTAM